jgi:hypothetical protein
MDDEDDIRTIEEALSTLNNAITWLKSMAEMADDDYDRQELAHGYEVDSDELEKAYEAVTTVLKPKLDPSSAGP